MKHIVEFCMRMVERAPAIPLLMLLSLCPSHVVSWDVSVNEFDVVIVEAIAPDTNHFRTMYFYIDFAPGHTSRCPSCVGAYTYMKFGLASLAEAASVTSDDVDMVILRMYNLGPINPATRVYLAPVTEAWDPYSLTFNSQPPLEPVMVDVLPNSSLANDYEVTVDITVLAKYWLDNPSTDFGMRIWVTEEYLFILNDVGIFNVPIPSLDVTFVHPETFAGPTGPVGQEGHQGTPGAMGPEGPLGKDGFDGAPGLDGPVGAVGAVGAIGEPGIEGQAGPQGEQGDEGDAGITGPTGSPGASGEQGPQGIVGVAGSPGPLGEPGPTGITGIQGPVGQTGGQGGQGEPGDRGERGVEGLEGEPGIQGTTGSQGKQGEQGLEGSAGKKGEEGERGEQGEEGPQGYEGPTGTTGSPGVKGAEGPPGSTGETGMKGDEGDEGPTGSTGAVGVQGNPGIQGNAGEEGVQGAQGDPGAPGEPGIQGEQGPEGPQGEEGVAPAYERPSEDVVYGVIDDIFTVNDVSSPGTSSENYLRLGRNYSGADHIPYLLFDLTGGLIDGLEMTEPIVSEQVKNAVMSIYTQYMYTTGPTYYHEVATSVDWLNYDPANPHIYLEVGDVEGSFEVDWDDVGQMYEVDVTELVKGWLDKPEENNGVAFTAQHGGIVIDSVRSRDASHRAFITVGLNAGLVYTLGTCDEPLCDYCDAGWDPVGDDVSYDGIHTIGLCERMFDYPEVIYE